MLGETKNQFSLTRAALSKGRRLESNFLSASSRAAGVCCCIWRLLVDSAWLAPCAGGVGRGADALFPGL